MVLHGVQHDTRGTKSRERKAVYFFEPVNLMRYVFWTDNRKRSSFKYERGHPAGVSKTNLVGKYIDNLSWAVRCCSPVTNDCSDKLLNFVSLVQFCNGGSKRLSNIRWANVFDFTKVWYFVDAN